MRTSKLRLTELSGTNMRIKVMNSLLTRSAVSSGIDRVLHCILHSILGWYSLA